MAVIIQPEIIPGVSQFQALPEVADTFVPTAQSIVAEGLDNILVEFTDRMAEGGNVLTVVPGMKAFIEQQIRGYKEPATPIAVEGFNQAGVWFGKRSIVEMVGKRSSWARQMFHGKQELILGGLEGSDQLTANLLAPGVEDWIVETSTIETATTSKTLASLWEQNAADAMIDAGGTVRDLSAAILSNSTIANATLAAGRILTPARAKMLAHDMAIWAMNEGSVLQYKESGVQAMQWFATDDAVVRPWHWALHGKIIDISAPFVMAGESIDFVDVDGNFGSHQIDLTIGHPPLEWNCRCTVVPVIF